MKISAKPITPANLRAMYNSNARLARRVEHSLSGNCYLVHENKLQCEMLAQAVPMQIAG